MSDPHSGTEGGSNAPISWMLVAVKPKEEEEADDLPSQVMTSRSGDFARACYGSNADARNFRRSSVGLFEGQKVARFQTLFIPQTCQETR